MTLLFIWVHVGYFADMGTIIWLHVGYFADIGTKSIVVRHCKLFRLSTGMVLWLQSHDFFSHPVDEYYRIVFCKWNDPCQILYEFFMDYLCKHNTNNLSCCVSMYNTNNQYCQYITYCISHEICICFVCCSYIINVYGFIWCTNPYYLGYCQVSNIRRTLVGN